MLRQAGGGIREEGSCKLGIKEEAVNITQKRRQPTLTTMRFFFFLL